MMSARAFACVHSETLPHYAQNSMATVVSGLPFANKIIGCEIGCERAFAVNGASVENVSFT